MHAIDDLLHKLKSGGGSDLHLSAGQAPRIRARGHLEPIAGCDAQSDAQLRELMREIASPAQWQNFERAHDLDFAYSLRGVARFRANYFVQQGGAGAVFRIIPEQIAPLSALNMPPAVERLASLEKGLVLVTGPTGSGKSTTLAAIIDHINATQARHIVTLEDPLEFVHQNKRSVLSHREVGHHTPSFADGLRAAIRQDADVVLVGELRDRETIWLALTAAEMGLLVFGTLHTNSACKTIDRIVDSFPAEQQAQVRLTLSESIAGIIAQLLIPTADGKGRRAAIEILLRTSALPNLIRENNGSMIQSLMQSGKKEGMQLMDDALLELVETKAITPRDAFMKATHKARFEPLLPQEGG
jgi:twitching motility protein PilT